MYLKKMYKTSEILEIAKYFDGQKDFSEEEEQKKALIFEK